jgi:hypothetical protein
MTPRNHNAPSTTSDPAVGCDDWFGDGICRYCSLPVNRADAVVTHSYWQGMKFVSHKACKAAGEKAEALECQTIDADCNDCRHYKRGKLAARVVSLLHRPDGTTVEVSHQPNIFVGGHCLKLDKPTIACPNKWTGHECFEHRRGESPNAAGELQPPPNNQK